MAIVPIENVFFCQKRPLSERNLIHRPQWRLQVPFSLSSTSTRRPPSLPLHLHRPLPPPPQPSLPPLTSFLTPSLLRDWAGQDPKWRRHGAGVVSRKQNCTRAGLGGGPEMERWGPSIHPGY